MGTGRKVIFITEKEAIARLLRLGRRPYQVYIYISRLTDKLTWSDSLICKHCALAATGFPALREHSVCKVPLIFKVPLIVNDLLYEK